MALQDLIDAAIARVTQAYDLFFEQVIGLPPYRDLWRVTSQNPCVFCRTMERISSEVIIPAGGSFPAPSLRILNYLSELDLTYVEDPPAHDFCECERISVPIT